MEPVSDFEIEDVENYRSTNDQKFSHSLLVMEILRKCSEAGSHEMRPGWVNEKQDNSGNIIRTYIEDTRKKFIEAVNTAKNILICDFDQTATENIQELQKELKDIKQKLLKEQWVWWSKKLSLSQRQEYVSNRNVLILPDVFNETQIYYSMFMEKEIETARGIFEELSLLTKRLDFYAEEVYEG